MKLQLKDGDTVEEIEATSFRAGLDAIYDRDNVQCYSTDGKTATFGTYEGKELTLKEKEDED